VLINRGTSLTKYFNNVAIHFEKMQADDNDAIRLKVDEINSLGEQIRSLNRQIVVAEGSGDTANDLRDSRGALVDELSKLVNVEVYETVAGKLPSGKEDRHFVVAISGKTLVDHYSMTKLEITQRKSKVNEEDIESLHQIAWEDGNELEIKGGELKGYLDMRDGNEGVNGTPNYKGIPYYIKKVNEFVRKFARTINEGLVDGAGTDKYLKKYSGHADGYGLQKPGTAVNPTGIRFFTMTGWSETNNRTMELESAEFMSGVDMSSLTEIGDAYDKVTAKNFSVSGDLLNQQFAEYNIAASKEAGFPEDNSNLLELLEMRHDNHLYGEGAPEDYMKSLVATLGIDSQQSVQIAKNQGNLTRQIENRRSSVSGVSLDEEMANMVKYQHAYNAAAKMISTMAEVYDTLINRVGV
jgi:flagellar hook-associated protein 1 FlgK